MKKLIFVFAALLLSSYAGSSQRFVKPEPAKVVDVKPHLDEAVRMLENLNRSIK